MTIGSILVCGFLILMEMRQIFSKEELNTVSVDTSNSGELKVTFDITFPRASCPSLNPDIMDFSGLRNETAKVSFEKLRLDRNGKPIGKDPLVIPSLGQDFFSTECFSCYEADNGRNSCCNTCLELESAYVSAGLDFQKILPIAPQCRQKYYLKLLEEYQGEGCRISGSIVGHRFPGNLHFSPGIAIEKSSFHGHIVEGLEKIKDFDLSHKINKLYFGDLNPALKSSLEGEEKSVRENSFMFSYHLRLVNSITIENDGKAKYNSYEYSTTQNTSKVNVSEALSGVFFHYEISPMLMTRRIVAKISLTSFLINVCSIIGGVFALSSIIDAVLFRVELKLAQKRSMGKAI